MIYLHCTFTEDVSIDNVQHIDIIVAKYSNLADAQKDCDARNYAYRSTGRTFYIEQVK